MGALKIELGSTTLVDVPGGARCGDAFEGGSNRFTQDAVAEPGLDSDDVAIFARGARKNTITCSVRRTHASAEDAAAFKLGHPADIPATVEETTITLDGAVIEFQSGIVTDCQIVIDLRSTLTTYTLLLADTAGVSGGTPASYVSIGGGSDPLLTLPTPNVIELLAPSNAAWDVLTDGGTIQELFDEIDAALHALATGGSVPAHAATHVNGTDDIQSATASQKGLATATQIAKLDGIEANADVTDTANVTAAGALMDSEVTDLAGVKGVTIAALQPKPSEGAFANGDKTKLDGIESGATADQTAAEIETAYNSQVSVVTQSDAEARSSTTVYRWTPLRVGQAIAAAVAGVIDSAPGALDTLNELAAALGDDANFAATITTALSGKQPLDATVTAFAALSGSADQIPYFNGSDSFALTAFTAFARTLAGCVDAAAGRTALGLGALSLLATVGTSQIDNAAVTYAKIQNVTSSRVLARKTAGAGTVEETTVAELLEMLGTMANGDILIRSGGAFTRLAVGSNDQILRVVSSLPAWDDEATGGGGITDGDALTVGLTFPDGGLKIVTPGPYTVTEKWAVTGAADHAITWTVPSGASSAYTLPASGTLLKDGSVLTSGLTYAHQTLKLRDSGGTYHVTLFTADTLTANRQLSFHLGDENRNVNLAGDITTAGAFVTAGAYSITLTAGANTNVTLPASGTLLTTSSTATLTNKTFDAEGTGNSLSNIDSGNVKSGSAILQEAMNIAIDGAGATVATGFRKHTWVAPCDGTITGWLTCGDGTESGSVTWGVKKNGSDVIGAGTAPAISSSTTATGSTMTSWTTSFSKGDKFTFNPSSVTTFTYIQLSIYYVKA